MKKKKIVVKGDKIKYKDGVGCCIWIPMDDDDDSSGLCFDFGEEYIDDIIKVLKELKKKEPEIFKEDPKQVEWDKKRDKKESTWYYKIWDKHFENISFQFTPFDWRNSRILLNIRRPNGKNKELLYKMVFSGFYFGPICVTW